MVSKDFYKSTANDNTWLWFLPEDERQDFIRFLETGEIVFQHDDESLRILSEAAAELDEVGYEPDIS